MDYEDMNDFTRPWHWVWLHHNCVCSQTGG